MQREPSQWCHTLRICTRDPREPTNNGNVLFLQALSNEMLLKWVCAGIAVACIHATEMQGISLQHQAIHPYFHSLEFQMRTNLDDMVQRCAQRAAENSVLIFGVDGTNSWSPNAAAESRRRLRFQPEDLQEPIYNCRMFAASESGRPLRFRLYQSPRSFECSRGNCTSGSDFSSLPPGVYRWSADQPGMSHVLQYGLPGISVEECELLAASYNLRRPAGTPAINAGTISYISGFQGVVPRCIGFALGEQRRYRRSESYVGSLTPQTLLAKSPAGDMYSSLDIVFPMNTSCTQKDVPSDLSTECKTFKYTLPPNTNATANLRTIWQEQFQLPDYLRQSIRAARQQYALTYRKIVQNVNKIFPTHFIADLSAYTAAEAVDECSRLALNQMHHTFNVFLSDVGWRCSHIFNFTTDSEWLNQVDRSVLQSYMYTANYTSQNDLEA